MTTSDLRKQTAEPSTADDLHTVQQRCFSQNTISNATWAASLFGDWHAKRCTEENSGIVRVNKPLAVMTCLLYTSPSPRDRQKSRMPSSA